MGTWRGYRNAFLDLIVHDVLLSVGVEDAGSVDYQDVLVLSLSSDILTLLCDGFGTSLGQETLFTQYCVGCGTFTNTRLPY